MPSLVKYFWPCIEIICASINGQERMTYGELAEKLGLKLAKQQWSELLDLVATKTRDEVEHDLTWNVVYGSGPAKGLGRYFSNGDKAPGSTLLDPKNPEQVAEYELTLKEIYKYTYEVKRVGNKDTVVKVPRSQ